LLKTTKPAFPAGFCFSHPLEFWKLRSRTKTFTAVTNLIRVIVEALQPLNKKSQVPSRSIYVG
jgi:hypothetical protein